MRYGPAMNLAAKDIVGLSARARAHTILHEVLDRRRPLDEVLQSDKRFARLETRDRAFARNLIATTLRRLGQIDAIIDDCLTVRCRNRPPRRATPFGLVSARSCFRHANACGGRHVGHAYRTAWAGQIQGPVNGILRRIVRTAEDIPRQPTQNTPTYRTGWRSWTNRSALNMRRRSPPPNCRPRRLI